MSTTSVAASAAARKAETDQSAWLRRVRVSAWFVAPLALWQLAIWFLGIPEKLLPGPSVTILNAARLIGTGETWTAIGGTALGWSISLLVGIVLAMPLALLLGSSDFAYRSSSLMVDFLRSLPALGLIPLALLLFGSSRPTELLVAIPTVMFPMLLQLIYGLKSMDPAVMETARSLRLARRTRFVRVQLPTMLPFFMTGLRISAVMGMLLCIGIEVLTGVPGIGAEVATAQAVGAMVNAYSYTLIAILINVLVTFTFQRLERIVVPWHGMHREEMS